MALDSVPTGTMLALKRARSNYEFNLDKYVMACPRITLRLCESEPGRAIQQLLLATQAQGIFKLDGSQNRVTRAKVPLDISGTRRTVRL